MDETKPKMLLAVAAVQKQELSVREAARQYKVSQNSLMRRVRGDIHANSRNGLSGVLTKQEIAQILQTIEQKKSHGERFTHADIRAYIRQLVISNNEHKENQQEGRIISDSFPSKSFLTKFLNKYKHTVPHDNPNMTFPPTVPPSFTSSLNVPSTTASTTTRIIRRAGRLEYIPGTNANECQISCTKIVQVHELVQASFMKLQALLTTKPCGRRPVFILLVQNDAMCAGVILASVQLKAIVILLSRSKKDALLPSVIQRTGVQLVVQATQDGQDVEFADMPTEGVGVGLTSDAWTAHDHLQQHGGVCMLTSGSTGDSKIVATSWDKMLLQGKATCEVLFPNNPCHFLCASSIGHAYAINALFAVYVSKFHSNSEIVLVSNAQSAAEILREEKKKQLIPIIFGTPGLYIQLIDLPGPFYVDKAYSAGSLLPQDLQSNFLGKHHIQLHQNYGSTETGGIAVGGINNSMIEYYPLLQHVGVAWPGVEIKIRKLQMNLHLGPSEDGEIMVKTPWQSIGYIVSADAAIQELDDFVNTCDAGKVSLTKNYGARNVYIGKRLRAPVLRLLGKLRVFVELYQLEECLLQYPNVTDAVAFMSKSGRLCAQVVATDKELVNESNVIDYLKGELPYIIVPDILNVVDFLECSPAGKNILLH